MSASPSYTFYKKKLKKPKVFECTSITPPEITLSLSPGEKSAKQRSTEAIKRVAERLRDVIRENDAETRLDWLREDGIHNKHYRHQSLTGEG